MEGGRDYSHACILSTGIGIGRAELRKKERKGNIKKGLIIPAILNFYPSYLIVPSLFGLGFCEDEDEEDED